MFSRFDTIPECYGAMDRRTDGRTDRIAISVLRVSKNINLVKTDR